MNVFSNVQLNASVLPYTNTTLAKTTNSITVTNFSHLNLSVGSSVTPGYGVMPPFSTQSFSVTPNEQITWQMQDASVPPASQANEYVSYTESVLHYASGLQMLAQLPLYDITVNGSLNITGGTVDATIQNASIAVTVPNGVQINNNSLDVAIPTGVNATIANTIDVNMTGSTVTQSSNVINDVLSSSPLVDYPSENFTITNLASGASLTGQTLGTSSNGIGSFDTVWLYIASQNGYISDYQITCASTEIVQYGLATQPVNTLFTNSEYNNAIAFTNPLVFAIPAVFNGLSIDIKNIGSSTIANDVLTIVLYARYASQTITNSTSSPVNTQGVQGSPTASGITNLSSANRYLVTFPAIANLVATKLIISGQWQGSATAANSDLSISTGGNTIAAYPLTGTLPNDYFPPINLDLGQGIVLGSDGLTIQETGALSDMQVEVFVILK